MEAYLFDSAIAAIRQRIANDDHVEQLIKIMISSGTAATCGIANMALFSILGRPEAKRDLETFLPQIADEGVRSLLRECLNPPLATAGTDFYGKLFRKVYEVASGLPEPAT
jgi:hypothetical protein